MKPALRVPLAALLVILGSPLAAVPCSVQAYDPNYQKKGDPVGQPAESPVCVRLDALERVFDSLLPAADALLAAQPRPPWEPAPRLTGTVRFSREAFQYADAPDAFNAFFWEGVVLATPEFLRQAERYPEMARYVVAHELAHAMQHASNAGRTVRCDRVFESQADMWGVELLRLAGSDPTAVVKGVGQFVADRVGPEEAEKVVSEDGMLAELKGGCTHPPGRLRFVNAVVAAHAPVERHALGSRRVLEGFGAERAEDGAAFDGGGSQKGGEVFAADPSPTPPVLPGRDRFDPAGRFSAPRMPPPPSAVKAKAKAGPAATPAAQAARRSLAAALYELGQSTSWTDPLLSRFIGRSAGKEFDGLYGAILAGIDDVAPTQVALKGALAMAERALAHVRAGGPRFTPPMLGRPEQTVQKRGPGGGAR